MNGDDLPADLEALYAVERDIPPVDPADAARAFSAVSAAIAAKSAGAAAGTAAGYTLKHMLTAAGLAFAGGAITYGAIDQALEETRTSESVSSPTAHVAIPPVGADAATETMDAGAETRIDAGVAETAVTIEDAGVARPRAALREPTTPDSIAAERRLLDAARFAAARGDIESALATLTEHRARFQEGTLALERDAMQIHLLVRAGRNEEARHAAERFRARYPRSLLLRSIEQALE